MSQQTNLITALLCALLVLNGCATKRSDLKDGEAISLEEFEALAGDGDSLESLERIDKIVPYKPVSVEPPAYPQAALRDGIEGHVILEFTITRAGTTENIKILEAKPPGIFENAALAAARQFRFAPRYINDEPVNTPGIAHLVRFKIKPDESK